MLKIRRVPPVHHAPREIMRDMFGRMVFAFALVVPALVASPVAGAEPDCPAAGCPHGPSSVNTPPPVNLNSSSYKDGYKSEHDYFVIPQNHAYLGSEMKNGYTAATACQAEVRGGPPPPNVNDWLAGCVDALHDLGFRP